ncbi:BspA family leucine-rich repeat surface protein [Eubacterium sp.]|uniref:BspA family leucine-rich repeat surface protein n=1 Tax=Eubacterium sp. TaxID=142586 RepID=UPI0026DFEEB5|nr:BspA family leucine-rich repeat surface protein [Eubacterium sp.]MDO5433839.1 BspA family leucine-rich repeat surface protein [Eubacterium sp.]
MGTVLEKLSHLRETKEAIQNAIIGRGAAVSSETTFRQYAELISQFPSDVETQAALKEILNDPEASGLSSELIADIKEIKDQIQTAIVEKGVFLESDAPFNTYPGAVNSINYYPSDIDPGTVMPVEDMAQCKQIITDDIQEGYTYKAIFLYYDEISRSFTVGGENEYAIKTCDGTFYSGKASETSEITHVWNDSLCETSAFNGAKIRWFIQYTKTEDSFVNDYAAAYVCVDTSAVSESILKQGNIGYYGIDGIRGARLQISKNPNLYTALFPYHLMFLLDIDFSEVTQASLFGSVDTFLKYPNLLNTNDLESIQNMFMMAKVRKAPYFDISSVKNMEGMFYSCTLLESVPLYDTSSIENMSTSFGWCHRLQILPNLDCSKVKNTSRMFQNCYSLTKMPVYDFPKLETADAMFDWCHSLHDIGVFNLPLCVSAKNMFAFCSSLTEINFSNTSSLKDATGMFTSCTRLRSVGVIDMSFVETADHMFSYCGCLEKLELRNINCSLDLSASTKFSAVSLVNVLNNLKQTTTEKTLTLGATNLEKLTAEQKAIATNKGWTLV